MAEMMRAARVYTDIETNEIANDPRERVRPRASAIWDGRVYATGIGVGWVNDGVRNEFYLPWRHQQNNLPREWLYEFREVFNEKEKVVHNFLHDDPAAKSLGLELSWDRTWDTLVMAHMINEEFPSKQLDWLAKYVLNDPGKDDTELKNLLKVLTWGEIPPSVMGPYCCKDVNLAGRLWEVFIRELLP